MIFFRFQLLSKSSISYLNCTLINDSISIDSVDKYANALAQMDQNINIMCLPSFIMQYLHRVKDQERLKKYMVTTTELIVFVLSSMCNLFLFETYFTICLSFEGRYSAKV